MGHSVTVPSNARPDNPEIQERILNLVRKSLRGDEVILRVVMDGDPEMGPSNSWEASYSVAWQSEQRDRGRDCGTHIAQLNSLGEELLIWGHYDLDNDAALRDCTERARPAH